MNQIPDKPIVVRHVGDGTTMPLAPSQDSLVATFGPGKYRLQVGPDGVELWRANDPAGGTRDAGRLATVAEMQAMNRAPPS